MWLKLPQSRPETTKHQKSLYSTKNLKARKRVDCQEGELHGQKVVSWFCFLFSYCFLFYFVSCILICYVALLPALCLIFTCPWSASCAVNPCDILLSLVITPWVFKSLSSLLSLSVRLFCFPVSALHSLFSHPVYSFYHWLVPYLFSTLHFWLLRVAFCSFRPFAFWSPFCL